MATSDQNRRFKQPGFRFPYCCLIRNGYARNVARTEPLNAGVFSREAGDWKN